MPVVPGEAHLGRSAMQRCPVWCWRPAGS